MTGLLTFFVLLIAAGGFVIHHFGAKPSRGPVFEVREAGGWATLIATPAPFPFRITIVSMGLSVFPAWIVGGMIYARDPETSAPPRCCLPDLDPCRHCHSAGLAGLPRPQAQSRARALASVRRWHSTWRGAHPGRSGPFRGPRQRARRSDRCGRRQRHSRGCWAHGGPNPFVVGRGELHGRGGSSWPAHRAGGRTDRRPSECSGYRSCAAAGALLARSFIGENARPPSRAAFVCAWKEQYPETSADKKCLCGGGLVEKGR